MIDFEFIFLISNSIMYFKKKHLIAFIIYGTLLKCELANVSYNSPDDIRAKLS